MWRVADNAYEVALITRGAGAHSYTYSGLAGLARGTLVAVSFRQRLEIGVILTIDSAPPVSEEMIPLWPFRDVEPPRWGALLLALCELCASAPHELAGHLLLAAAAQGLKLELAVLDPKGAGTDVISALGELTGQFTPAKRKALMTLGRWDELASLAQLGILSLELGFAGMPGVTRAHVRYRRWYRLDRQTASLLGLPGKGEIVLPGSYLAGFTTRANVWEEHVTPAEIAEPPIPSAHQGKLEWEALAWPEDWEVCRRWPVLQDIPVARAFATWPLLRSEHGLVAEVSAAVAGGQNLLVIVPQTWLLNRVWAALAPWAPWVHRYEPEAGPSAAAHILGKLQSAGQVVAGTEGAWKLAAYGQFDRVLLVDPTHPQYTPEGAGSVDARAGVLLALAGSGASLGMIELGISAWDGRSQLESVRILPPHQAAPTPPSMPVHTDTDPLPLELRQPGTRRLVYFNRLGRSRGLRCIECDAAVYCPQCNGARIYYSQAEAAYVCPACGFQQRDLRCQRCGLATLAAQHPGLEAVVRRPGDCIVHHGRAGKTFRTDCRTLLGTAQLLEPPPGYWPQEIVVVHAEDRAMFMDDWPEVLDTTARLLSIYANPELTAAYVVSRRLHEQLDASLNNEQLRERWAIEMRLRRLAGLPPMGCAYTLSAVGRNADVVTAARDLLGKRLATHPATNLLRLGKVFSQQRRARLRGILVNAGIGWEELQQLRWELQRGGTSLTFKASYGPWL